MRLLLLLLHAANASLSQYFRRHKVKDAIPAAIASTIVRANASGHFPFDWNRLTLCEVLRKRGRPQKAPGGHAHHPKPKVTCTHPGCGKEFAWQQDLAKHVRRYHSGEEPRFACTHDGCEKKFYERKLLVAHERTHTDERPFACKHPGCGKAFRARNALAYHQKALHESGVVLRCDVEGCRFTTRKSEALATHKLRHQQRAPRSFAW